jgi:hypothetical protein
MKLSDLELLEPGELTPVPVEENMHEMFLRRYAIRLREDGWNNWAKYPPPDALCEITTTERYDFVLAVPSDLSHYLNAVSLWWRLTGIGRMQLEGEL